MFLFSIYNPICDVKTMYMVINANDRADAKIIADKHCREQGHILKPKFVRELTDKAIIFSTVEEVSNG